MLSLILFFKNNEYSDFSAFYSSFGKWVHFSLFTQSRDSIQIESLAELINI